jgi:predicted nucleic acid-binding protein
MGIKYLWDTNTSVYYLQQQFPPSAEKFIDNVLEEYQPALSVITEIELLCWKSTVEKDIEILRTFIEDSILFDLSKNIKVKTAEIRKSYRIKLPDAIIAATAIENNLILLTRNVKDFKDIQSIQILNPFEI